MLTRQQDRILQFLRTHLARHGHGPSLEEIGTAVGIRSKGTVHRHVQALIDKGYLQREARSWRSLRLTDTPTPSPAVLPLVGRIAAGRPIEAIEGQDEINLAEVLMGPGRYVLQVRGDSMVEAGILDGDLVVIQQQDTADDGDIVVALIDDEEATLKRLRHTPNGQIWLIPENPAMQPMTYPPERVRIQGVLVGQFRSYR